MFYIVISLLLIVICVVYYYLCVVDCYLCCELLYVCCTLLYVCVIHCYMSVVESDEAFCGNGIVEEGEECDCGYTEDCKDNCCNPRDTRISASADTLKCTLKIVSGAKVKCR